MEKLVTKTLKAPNKAGLPMTQGTDVNQLDFRPLFNNHAVPQNVSD